MAKNQPIFAIFSQKNWIVELQKIAIPVFYHYPQGRAENSSKSIRGVALHFRQFGRDGITGVTTVSSLR